MPTCFPSPDHLTVDAAAERSAAEAPGRTPPGRLLAVRQAGAAFDGPFALGAPRFERLLEERAALRAELAAVREGLIEALHAAVPGAPDAGERRALLELKRDVFNLRSPAARHHRPPPGLEAPLACYAALCEREAGLLDQALPEVVAEQRRAVAALLREERFRLACRYSSAALWEEVEHGAAPPPDGFSSLERGLYAYAARFTTKANPFHLFAEVAFPPAAGMEPGGPHEVVLSPTLLRALEAECLAADPGRAWLFLRPCAAAEGKARFWIPGARGARVLSLSAGPELAALAGYFAARQRRTGRPTGPRTGLAAYLRRRLGPEGGARAEALCDALLAREAAGVFLPPGAGGTPRGGGARARRLARLHRARLDTAALGRAEAVLAAEARGDRPTHHVNSYARADTAAHEAAAEALGDTLRALKPFFAAEHNFSAHDAVVRAFAADALRGSGAAPLLDLSGSFLRTLNEWAARCHAAGADERARLAAWRAALAAETGWISRERLEALLPTPRPPARPLCCNGPFDYVEGVFYLSNVWAGDGRFAARYLLHRRRERPQRPAEPGVLDVELAVPHDTGLTRVVRAFATGCGFDARLAHEFARWIDPAEVVVEAAPDGSPGYRHAPTGTPLRFHYRGFLLAGHLPAEYQLLLAGHADLFENPFAGTDEPAPGGAVRHLAALHHGPVCLRRERWVVPAALLAERVCGAGPVRGAVRLRDWVHERLLAADRWYYRVPGARGKEYKPRFLDLRNPLCVATFRRVLGALPPEAVVALSPMRPVAAHLHLHQGAPYVTELMVEV